MLREAAALAPKAPRPLAELGWAMLKAGGEGCEVRARRVLERAATLAGGGGDDVEDAAAAAPPDIAARLGIARFREAQAATGAGPEPRAAAAAAAAKGAGTAHAALLVAAASEVRTDE